MAAWVLARLGAGAAAAATAGPACFDAAAAGEGLWVAARCDERSVAIVHALAAGAGGNSASSGSVHALISLPEPVAIVQLGAAQVGAEEPGPAVLLLVGASCRLWAFQLHPPAQSGGAPQQGLPAKVTATDSDAVAVPLAQPACPARHQLAAAVAWEHLAFSWDPVSVGSVGEGAGCSNTPHSSRDRSGVDSVAVPLPLHKLAAALRQYSSSGQQDGWMPLQVHSVASWVCQLPVAAAGTPAPVAEAIPADATAAAYVGCAGGTVGGLARLTCQARYELPVPADHGILSSPVGYLVVATARGQVLTLPVGTPAWSGQHEGAQHQADDASAALLPVAVCIGSSSMCIVPAQEFDQEESCRSCATGSKGASELVLLAEAGQLGLAAPAGLGSCRATMTASGSNHKSSSDASPAALTSCVAAGVCSATVLLAGVRSAAAVGSTLCYVPTSCGSTGSMLRCMDLGDQSGLLQAAASDMPLAGLREGGAGQPLLLAATAATAEQRQRQQLVVLTSQGTVLAVAGAKISGGQHDSGVVQSPSVPSLEASIQVISFLACSIPSGAKLSS